MVAGTRDAGIALTGRWFVTGTWLTMLLLLAPACMNGDPRSPAVEDAEGHDASAPLRDCRSAPTELPALLEISLLDHSRPYGPPHGWTPWTFDDAMAALESAKLDTAILERIGERRWTGEISLPGTIGALLNSGRDLEAIAPPGKASPASVRIYCEGHGSLTHADLPEDRHPEGGPGWLQIEVESEIDASIVVAELGGLESIVYPVGRTSAGTRVWQLRTSPNIVMERITHYLGRGEVLRALPTVDCMPGEEQPVIRCDFSVTPAAIEQGLVGSVTLKEGSCTRPERADPDRPPTPTDRDCRSRPGIGKVLAYQPLLRPADFRGGLFVGSQPPIAFTNLKSGGRFELPLAPGEYSILVDAGRGQECDFVSRDGACRLTVHPGLTSHHRVMQRPYQP